MIMNMIMKLNKTLVCSACDQVKDVDPVVVNFVCSKVFHLSYGEALLSVVK